MYEEESDSEPEEDSEYIHDETEEIEEPKKEKKTHKKEKIISFSISITMQREIRDKAFLGNTVSPYNDPGRSSAIDRTASNYNNVKEKI